MSWTTPITDRTQADVDFANLLENRANTTENKGARSHWTLQRIANNLRYVVERFNELGIATQPLQSKATWLMTDIPKISDIRDFESDLNNLRALGYIRTTSPVVPNLPWTHFLKLNDIEQLLWDMTVVIAGILAPTRHSDTFYSGEEGLI